MWTYKPAISRDKSHRITKIKNQPNNTSWNTAETKKAISIATPCNDMGKNNKEKLW